MRKFIFILALLLLCRCASMEKSVGLGIGIGAATGISTSQIAHYNTKGTVVLGLGGAIIGGVLAALSRWNQAIPSVSEALGRRARQEGD